MIIVIVDPCVAKSLIRLGLLKQITNVYVFLHFLITIFRFWVEGGPRNRDNVPFLNLPDS